MCKFLKKLFRCTDETARDENQKWYRAKFGIVDRYLLEYSIDSSSADESYIIFIDYEYAIDWVDSRDKSKWEKTDRTEFENQMARFELLQSRPIFNLTNKEKIAYKVMLGAAYIQAFHRNFSTIDSIINEADKYYRKRCSENARKYCLNYAGVIAILVLVLLLMLHATNCMRPECFKWTLSVGMGVIGAYVSIWGRYTHYVLEGVSSPCLYILESVSRLFIGGIFAFVALLCIKCGLAFSFIAAEIEVYAFALCGFVCGFSEHFIPSLIERISSSDTNQK